MKKIVFSVFAILMVVLLSACGEPSGSRQGIDNQLDYLE